MSEKVKYIFPDNYKLELGNISISYPNFNYQKENGDTVFRTWTIYPAWDYCIDVRVEKIDKKFTLHMHPNFDLTIDSVKRDSFVLDVYENLKEIVLEVDKNKALDELHNLLEKWDINLSTKCISIGNAPVRWNRRFESDYPRLTNPLIRGSS